MTTISKEDLFIDKFYDKTLDEYKIIHINYRKHLLNYKSNIFTKKGNKVEFATLLASQQDIENNLLQSCNKLKHIENNLEKNMENLEDKNNDEYSAYELLQRKYEIARILTEENIEGYKNNINQLEEYKKSNYMDYKYKATELEIIRIIEEFIDNNGHHSMYEFNFYNKYFKVEELRIGYVSLHRDDDYEGGWTPTYLCLNLENGDKNRDNSPYLYTKTIGDFDIRLDDSHIVYDKNCIIVITEKYDLILELIEKREKTNDKIVSIEDDGRF